MSEKAKAEFIIWMRIKQERMAKLKAKFGYVPCEYCYGKTDTASQLNYPEAHHNDQNRRNNTADNCRILHRYCNQHIEDIGFKSLIPSLLENAIMFSVTR